MPAPPVTRHLLSLDHARPRLLTAILAPSLRPRSATRPRAGREPVPRNRVRERLPLLDDRAGELGHDVPQRLALRKSRRVHVTEPVGDERLPALIRRRAVCPDESTPRSWIMIRATGFMSSHTMVRLDPPNSVVRIFVGLSQFT